MAKQMTIRLAHYVTPEGAAGKARHQWKVLQVTDSTRFHPSEWLEKDAVSDLCDDAAWKVTIVPSQE